MNRVLSIDPPQVEPWMVTGTGRGQNTGWPEISAWSHPLYRTVGCRPGARGGDWRKVLCRPTGQVCLFQYRWELGRCGLGPVLQRFAGIRGEIRL